MIFLIVLIILFFDRLTKILATKNLSLSESYPLIKGYFHLTLAHNRGAAFGILKNHLYLFVLTSVIAIVLIFLDLHKHRHKKISLYSLSLALILSGAIGNLIDRLYFGYVIDFLDFRIWPVFNVADSAITVGAILLGWSIITNDKSQVSRDPANSWSVKSH
ncbi:MAG: signal peptidase II [Candidatus Omnitrophota bacterium]